MGFSVEYRNECAECGSIWISENYGEYCTECPTEEPEPETEETTSGKRDISAGNFPPEPKDTYNTRHGRQFEEMRQRALERDGYECQSCGISNSEHIKDPELFGGGLHVHHKTPTTDGGTHDLDNLVTLCADCHLDN